MRGWPPVRARWCSSVLSIAFGLPEAARCGSGGRWHYLQTIVEDAIRTCVPLGAL